MVSIEVISFDMEGTLIDGTFSGLIWENDIPYLYAKKNCLDFDRAKKYIIKEYDSIGAGNPEWYDVNYWFERLGLEGDWMELLLNRRDDCRIYSETIGILNRLSQRYTLMISSNTIREFLIIQLEKLPRVFKHVFSAPSDFNSVKNTYFFNKVCKMVGSEPEKIVHIGDSIIYDYVEPLSMGMRAFHLDRSRETSGDHIVHNLIEFEEILRALKNCLNIKNIFQRRV